MKTANNHLQNFSSVFAGYFRKAVLKSLFSAM